MIFEYANNARTTLASGINETDTSLTVSTGTGAEFPVITSGQAFYCTLLDAATLTINEIVEVTARSGDVFTIVRGQQGTTAQVWIAGSIVTQLITAGDLANFVQAAQLPSFGTTTYPLTMDNSGTGAASGTNFDGSAAQTISYNTIGALSTASFTGTNHQLGASGYQKFPGGLIMQWGKLTGYTLGSGPQTITQAFVFAFPTACVNVQLTGWGYGNSAGQNSASVNPPTLYANGGTVSTTGFTWIMENLSNLNGLHWFAIGY